MKWPEDFSWKHKLVVASPALAGWIAGWISLGVFGILLKSAMSLPLGLMVIEGLMALLFFSIAMICWIQGAAITKEWMENLEEDLGDVLDE